MSGKISGMIWDLDLPHAEAYVLLAMADHADHEGNNVYPSIGLIAWKTNYSERQVYRVLSELRRKKILVAIETVAGQVVRYRIDLARAPLKPPRETKQTATPDMMSSSDPRHNGRATHDKMSSPPDTMSPHTPAILSGGDDIAMSGGGDDIAMSGGDDIAMSGEPSVKRHSMNRQLRAAAAAASPSAQNGSMDQGRAARNGHQPSAQNVSPAAAAAAAVFGAIISPTDAIRLVETHPACIDHAEALVREASKPKINDPAAMLVHLVTTGWIPPAVTSNGHGPEGDDEVNGYLVGYCPTCAAITFGSCGHDEQQAVTSGRGSRKGRKATV